MAPAQRFLVLRCYSCRLFQVHQVKSSLKWTCKACGEKQSFLRVYGEGSGADCRRHVQKLNLLQGQVSELSFRSLEEAVSASEEKPGHQEAENRSLQVRSQPSENRWLKYVDKDCVEQEPGRGANLHTQPSCSAEQPGFHFSSALPRKRKWSQSTDQSPYRLDVQDLDDTEVTVEPQGHTGLARTSPPSGSHFLQSSAHRHTGPLAFPQWKLPTLAQQVMAPSPGQAQFPLSPGNRSHVDLELPRPLQRGPRTETPRGGDLSSPPTTAQLSGVRHTPTSRGERLSRKPPKQLRGIGTLQTEGGPWPQGSQKAPPMRLCDLFTTGEDFEDDL